jgi:hypothetical protein
MLSRKCHASRGKQPQFCGKWQQKKEKVVCGNLLQLAEFVRLATPLARFGKTVRTASKQDVVGSNPTGRTTSLSFQRFVCEMTVCFFDRWSGMTKLWLFRSFSLVPIAYVNRANCACVENHVLSKNVIHVGGTTVGQQVVLMKCNWPPRACGDSPARASYNAVFCIVSECPGVDRFGQHWRVSQD